LKQRIEIPQIANCVTIDVGKNTGLSFWDGTFFPSTETVTYKGKIKGNESKYIEYMTDSVYDLLRASIKTNYDFIQIEGVEVWETSSKSMASATRGDLIRLAYLVGAYILVAQKFTRKVIVKTAPEWKSQLSKEATVARVKRINGLTYENEHVTDAVAMGFANVENIWLLKRVIAK